MGGLRGSASGWALAGLLVAAALTVAGGSAWAEKAGRPEGAIPVFATIDPLAWFVERVGGDRVQVESLVAGGECAETYEATPKQMARLSRARAYFAIGMPMEEILVPRLKANAPKLVVFDVRAGIPLRDLSGDHLRPDGSGSAAVPETAGHDHPRGDGPDAGDDAGHDAAHDHAHEPAQGDAHEHGPDTDGDAQDHAHDHAHEGTDPHLWLNPRYGLLLASNVADGLIAIDPEGAEVYRANLAALQTELRDLDRAIAALLAPVRGREMLVYHPFYGYLAEAYGLKQVAIEVGGFKPGSKYLASVIAWAKARQVHAIFIQIGPSAGPAITLAKEIGGQVIALDPLSRDYMANLRTMAQRIRDGLSGPPPGSRG